METRRECCINATVRTTRTMGAITVLWLLCLTVPIWAQDGKGLYSINADTVLVDSANGVTAYKGNAKAEVKNLLIEADTISIFSDGGLPSRIEAIGNPLKFRQRGSNGNLSGTAQKVIFLIPELKLTLIDYVIVDPSNNNMKGRNATIVLKP